MANEGLVYLLDRIGGSMMMMEGQLAEARGQLGAQAAELAKLRPPRDEPEVDAVSPVPNAENPNTPSPEAIALAESTPPSVPEQDEV